MAPEEDPRPNNEQPAAPSASETSRSDPPRHDRRGRGRGRGRGRRRKPAAPAEPSAPGAAEAQRVFETTEVSATAHEQESEAEARDSEALALVQSSPLSSADDRTEAVREELIAEPPRAPAPQPRPPLAEPSSKPSIEQAIDDVSQIIETLKRSLDDMEELLEMLELFERQTLGDEREIESLRRALRQLQRPRGGGPAPRDRG
jgi:hypothetical protein